MSSKIIRFDDEDSVEEFEVKGLEEELNKQEAEDDNTLTESDNIINQTQKLFIDDEKLDYNIKSDLVFKIGEIANHFNLKPEELDRFANVYESIHRLQFSQAILHKSLKDQLKQKGNKIEINRGLSTWESMLDKLSDVKMMDFLCNLVGINEEYKDKIMSKEIDKLFGPTTTNTLNIPKNIERNEQMDNLAVLMKKINHKLNKV